MYNNSEEGGNEYGSKMKSSSTKMKMKSKMMKKPLPEEKKTKMKMSGAKAYYKNMSASALKKLLMEKKTALLIKSGFPEGKIPRGKDAMINLCIKLKRKRW